LSTISRDACVALLVLAGCAGVGPVRGDLDALRAEVRALRRDNEELARKVDALSGRMDLVTARLTRAPAAEASPSAAPSAASSAASSGGDVPRDLAVVKISPPAATPRAGRAAPPIPTAVPIAEPDPARLDALARPSRRELAAEADTELRAARRRDGVARAHALEDFTERYPRHPAADNALLEAAEAYAAADKDEAACALARRIPTEYPAGDAMSDALERLATCESRIGMRDAERRLLDRVVTDYPSTAAATRARARLATISGQTGAIAPGAGPARSAP
jgi:TolA-binding protein